MKKDRKWKENPKKEYDGNDTRGFGLYLYGPEHRVKILPRQVEKTCYTLFDPQMKRVMEKRKTHYFYPAVRDYMDYACNEFVEEMKKIEEEWENTFKKTINRTLEDIKKPEIVYPGDYDLLRCGIVGGNSAQMWANYQNMKNQDEYMDQVINTEFGLYSQFIHQMTSRVEAVSVKVLTKNHMIEDHFDRDILYGGIQKSNDKKTAVRQLPHFSAHDKLYCIWNFLKHNSASTYQALYDRYPEVVSEDKFEQGKLALYYVKFSDELITELISGLKEFFKEYCELMFQENYEEAQWNYEKYFYELVTDTMESINNPLGIHWWDID